MVGRADHQVDRERVRDRLSNGELPDVDVALTGGEGELEGCHGVSLHIGKETIFALGRRFGDHFFFFGVSGSGRAGGLAPPGASLTTTFIETFAAPCFALTPAIHSMSSCTLGLLDSMM